MKKSIVFFFIILIHLPLIGQDVQKMNSVKRSSQYLYAEATMDNESDAYNVANDLLLVKIKEYINEKKLEGKEIVIKDINKAQCSIQIPRGDMTKVFLYVKKSDIQSAGNVTVLPVSEVSSDISPDKPVTVPSETSPFVRIEAPWQKEVIDMLLSAGSYSEARSILSRLKVEFKIKKTGPMVECRKPDEVYLLVGKNGSVVTVLGPGSGSRPDFKASAMTSEKFDGYDKVWFIFTK